MSRHRSLAGVNLHPAFNWVQDDDPITTNPDDVIDGHYWHETDTGRIWYRDTGAWVSAGGGGALVPGDITGFDEQAQDAVGGIVGDTSSIALTYDDAGNAITADIVDAYVQELARDTLGTALTAGTGISVTPSDVGDTITLASTITQYTDELAQDAVANAFAAGSHTGITVTYTDGSNKFDLVVTATGAEVLDDLTDVDVSGATDGDVLTYDNGTSTWINAPSSNITVLDDIPDVDVTGATDGDVLTYDNGTSKWISSAPASGAMSLDDLDDVNVAGVANGNLLSYDLGTDTWIPTSPASGYTDEQVRDVMGVALVAGAGITVTPNDGADQITVASTITQYTDELAQDAIGAAIAAGAQTGITVTYTDASNKIDYTVSAEYIQDTVGAMFADSTNIDVTYDDSGNAETIDLTAQAKTMTLNYVIDGGGLAIVAGIKGDLVVDFPCTIIGVTTLADVSGSIVIDIWKDTYANFPPTVGDTITASALPTLSAATKAQDTTLTGWTTSISAGDILRFNVNSASTITRVTLALKVRRS